MADLDLDTRLDELFASEPKNFTATRDVLVRDLKAADRAEDAAEVKALRKPTVAVAAVNRVARTHADQVAALVEIGAELAALQAEARPDRDELRDLTRATTHPAPAAHRARRRHHRTAGRGPLVDHRDARHRVPRRRAARRPAARPPDPGALPRDALRARRRRPVVTTSWPARDETGCTTAARRAGGATSARRARDGSGTPADDAEESAPRARRRRHRSDRAPRGRAPSHRRPRGRPGRRPRRTRRAQARRARARNEPNVARSPNGTAPRRRSTPPNAWSTARRRGKGELAPATGKAHARSSTIRP